MTGLMSWTSAASGDENDSLVSPTKGLPTTPGVGQGSAIGGSVRYEWSQESQTRRSPVTAMDPLVAAQRAIVAATDSAGGHSSIERSNSFDFWKSLLVEVARTALTRSVGFRQVLGATLATVHQRDMCDFSPENLTALRTITNILHSPSVGPPDVGRALRALEGMATVLPLAVVADDESPESDAEAEAIIRSMIKRHEP